MSCWARTFGDFSSFAVTVREMTRPWRQRPGSPGQSYVPGVVITMSCSATYWGLTQPSSSGNVMPLSSSTTTDGSSAEGAEVDAEGDGVSLTGGDTAVVGVVAAAASPPPSSRRSRTAPVTIEATRTAPATESATALARPEPPPPGDSGCVNGSWGASGWRRWSVHAVPSHQRSTSGYDGSRYQPGGGVILIPAL